MTKTLDQQVLSWLNLQREKLALDPLKEIRGGRRRHFSYCPVALSLNDEPGTIRIASWGWQRYDAEQEYHTLIPIPDYVQDFIRKFDNGDYDEFHDLDHSRPASTQARGPEEDSS